MEPDLPTAPDADTPWGAEHLDDSADLSLGFRKIQHDIRNSQGVPYDEFVKTLQPDYIRVWKDIFAGYAGLAGVVAVTAVVSAAFPPWGALVALPAGMCIGYGIAYLALFHHEASHYNIAKTPRRNDRLANIFTGPLAAADIRAYRPIHFGHHKYIGTPDDTERAYFDAVTPRSLLESLTGIKAAKVLLFRRSVQHQQHYSTQPPRPLSLVVVAGLMLHVAIIAVAAYAGAWAVSVAWGLGLVIFFPFFFWLRQVLEHRDTNARPDIDYTAVPHGAVSRMFGTDLFSRTFGPAGFNRHLIHHWDPRISYTRLEDLERYLMDTSLAPILDKRRSSYWAIFRALLRQGRDTIAGQHAQTAA